MDFERMTDETLLALLIGEGATKSLYRGTLRPFFAHQREQDQALRPLFIARELHQRWLAEDLGNRDLLNSPTEVKRFLIATFAGQAHESFATIYLDAQSRLIVAEESFRGTLAQTAVYPREIVRRAVETNAASVIFAHNHPSGCAEPSRADEVLTQTMKTALALIDVRVLDHIVVAGSATMSFAERHLL